MKVKVNLATWLKEFLEIWVFIYISPGGDQAAKASFSQSAVKCYLVSGSGYVTDLTAAAEQLSWGPFPDNRRTLLNGKGLKKACARSQRLKWGGPPGMALDPN
jgi:hypothetical protein